MKKLLILAACFATMFVFTGCGDDSKGGTGKTDSASNDKGSAAIARAELEAHIDGKEFVCCNSSRNVTGRPKRISLNYARENDNTYSFYVLWLECRNHGSQGNNYLVTYKGNGKYTIRLLN